MSAELTRRFVNESVSIRHCPHRTDLPGLLNAGRRPILLVSLQDKARECVELLRARIPALIVAVGSATHRDLECSLREAGVCSLILGPVSADELSRRIRRLSSE